MKIACIGTGFVGVVTSAVMAKLGHSVAGLDIDENKIKSLRNGKAPFFEPGLEELLAETQSSRTLTFTSSYEEAIIGAEVVFVMVGTPSLPDGQADIKYVVSAAASLAPFLEEGAVVVIKSTVPPGTNRKIEETIRNQTNVSFTTASVPEFLKEGSAVEDTLRPDRIIIGAYDKQTGDILADLHRPLTENIIRMLPESAQMAKYASNAYLAQRITFINQIANLCEKNNADIEEVIKGMGADHRIGSHYWYPGLGYGGSCFPKDVREIAAYSKAVGESDSIFIKISELNDARIPKLMKGYDRFVGGFSGKKVAVLGLSFKPNTNDIREAPALKVIPWLLEHGATVSASDPQAVDVIRPHLPSSVSFHPDAYSAIIGTSVVMLLIEWDEYKSLDMSRVSSLMANGKYFIDTRNQYDKASVEAQGISYKGVGR